MKTNSKKAVGVGAYIFNYNRNGVWMNVAICNNDNKLNSNLLCWLNSISQRVNENIFVDIFDTGIEMISNINSGECYDLIFVNCERNDNNFDLGTYIREKMCNYKVEMVYILSTNQVPVKLANTKPLVIIETPVTEKDLERAIELFFSSKSDLRSNYFLKTRNTKKLIPYKDIMYISSDIRILTIVTNSETYTCYDKIKNIPDIPGFYRINKSYLINANYLKTYTKNYIIMEDNEKISISRNIHKEIRNELKLYVIQNSIDK